MIPNAWEIARPSLHIGIHQTHFHLRAEARVFPPVSGSASGINSLKKRQFRISSAVVHLEALRLLLRLAFADYPPSAVMLPTLGGHSSSVGCHVESGL